MADLATSEIVTAVRNKLSDDQFDQVLIIDAINFFINELYHNTRTRRMETYDQIFSSAGDTDADFPDDMQTLINLTVTAGPSSAPYDFSTKYYEYGDFMRVFPKWLTDVPADPTAWTQFGNQIRYAAPLLEDTTIDIDYLRTPVPALLTENTPTDTIELDELYKELATEGALARCMESNEDYAEASSERGNLAPLVTAWIRNEGRSGVKTGPTIMRSNRNKGYKYSRNRLMS
jgi:hypothetical protein